MNGALSNEERRRLTYERQNAVRCAWKEEKARVADGHGTREWSPDEQSELLERGCVQGYEGHHMKSVSLYPEYAGNPDNIQFLTEDEHLNGAHQGSYHNKTNGYYDPKTGEMHEFGDELGELPDYKLSEHTIDSVREAYERDADAAPAEGANAQLSSGADHAESAGSGESSGASHSGGRR